MILFIIFKLIIVVAFLVLFLRRPTIANAIGLLAVTLAVLLDTFLGTFNREQLLGDLGFFFYIIAGFLFAGAALWMWMMLRPLVGQPAERVSGGIPMVVRAAPAAMPVPPGRTREELGLDRQMLYDQIRQRFGREDVLDLMFDLEIPESEVMGLGLDQNLSQLVINIMDAAEQQGKGQHLALAVERILTPPPPEHLPRLEKLTVESPPTVLRQFLLAHYNLSQLEEIATDLGIDWETLGAGSKKERVRALLQYLYRRNRIGELIDRLHTAENAGTLADTFAGDQ
jgi:hypothetical protein